MTSQSSQTPLQENPATPNSPKVALVCDWLASIGGAERVLKSLHDLYPDAPIYTSQYDKKGIDWFNDADVRTGWLQIFPSKLRRFLAPLRQLYFKHLNLSNYDLIISVTGAEAKFIHKGTAIHLCYCHVPTQYYWQLYDEYVKHPGFGALDPIVRIFFQLLVKPLRRADYRAAQCPDAFITISKYSAEQIKKYYDRESVIIAPPVAVENFYNTKKGKRQGFINISRQVSWKRLDLIIKACIATENHLTLIGDGPEHNNLVKIANRSPFITFFPIMPQSRLKDYLADAEAFLFPSLEPFGIAPVEALAAGCPVIAYEKGGASDYVLDGKNGITFGRQSVNSVISALKKFQQSDFSRAEIKKTAESFSEPSFQHKICTFVQDTLNGATIDSQTPSTPQKHNNNSNS